MTAFVPTAQDPRPHPPVVSLHHSERSAWRASWDQDPKLSPTEKRILEIVRRRLNKNNVCWPSQETIARDCGNISTRTVGRALRRLEGHWVRRVRRHHPRTGNRTSDLIQICFPQQELPFLRGLDPDRFDMPVAYRGKEAPVHKSGSRPDGDGSFLVAEGGGLSDKLAPGLEDKMSEEPSAQREPQDNVLQAALCRSIQASSAGAVAAGEPEGEGLGGTSQVEDFTGAHEVQVSAGEPEASRRCPDNAVALSAEAGVEQLCSLWSELLQDADHERACQYSYQALQVSMLRGYSAKVLLTALAMLLDKLAHRRRDLRPIKDIRAYYGSLLHVANQDPERTGGGQEWSCHRWSRAQLEQIKRGQRPHQVRALPDRARVEETCEPRLELARPERPALVMPRWAPSPQGSLDDVSEVVRQLHQASPRVVAGGILARVRGEMERLAAAWRDAGGPSEALTYLQEAQEERRAMGLET